jgi:hypothetical protein
MFVGAAGALWAGTLPIVAGEEESTDFCYWDKRQSICDSGTEYEYWCYVCCIDGTCNTHQCEWREAGSC